MKPFFYFLVLVVSMLCIALLPNARELLALHPSAGLLQEYQLWRWLSAHITHASWTHLNLNLLNLVLLRIIFIRWLPTNIWLLLMLSSSLIISAGLILTSTFDSYMGFSGIFYSLLIYFLLQQWHTHTLMYSGVIMLVVVKIAYEKTVGTSADLEALINIKVASDAHVWGALAGAIFWGLQRQLKLHQRH